VALSSEFQVEYGELLTGDGTPYDITSITGLRDLPDMRTQDTPRVGRHGDSSGDDLASGKVVTVEYELVGSSEEIHAALLALEAATAPAGLKSWRIRLPGASDRFMRAKPRRRSIPLDVRHVLGVASCVVQWYAPDPRLYAAAEAELSTGPGGAGTGGITPPLTPPVVPGGSTVGGRITVVNDGNVPAPLRLRVTGPVPGFDLQHLGLGRTIRYRQAVAAGDWVEFDSDARTVLLNGTASRRTFMSGAWFDAEPGLNELLFLPTGAAAGSLFTARFRSAWL
jgi:hypothetical protein